ncbi:hypothetical protein K7X08_030478 [Anisodus acutangulus]|uniref:Uncharacterized protein n=1 Tax=Anisodus acutangulus TaxID=402998 RepID=A0A9Q1QV71_9SOLA|nr:hypothetical protein K7X08_030478 [Anisodus acutangulus]
MPLEETNCKNENKEEQRDTGVEYVNKENNEDHNDNVVEVEQVMEYPELIKESEATLTTKEWFERAFVSAEVNEEGNVDKSQEMCTNGNNSDNSNTTQLVANEEVAEIHTHDQLMVSIDMNGVGSFPLSRDEVVHKSNIFIEEKDELHDAGKSVVQVNTEKQIITQIKNNPLQELHDVVSHNIDFAANVNTNTKDVACNSKIKDTADEGNLEPVFHRVAREAGISSKSMQKGL